MARRGQVAVTLVAATAACIIGVGWASAASALDATEGAAALVDPSEKVGGAEFYDWPSAKLAWTRSVEAFDEKLPAGSAISTSSPWSEASLAPGKNIFEVSLVDMTLANEYRCAWLRSEIAGTATAKEVDGAIETYWSLPSVAEFDLTGLRGENLTNVAKQLGYASEHLALHDLTCTATEKN